MTNATTTDVINRHTIHYATGSRNNERIFLVVANDETATFAVYVQDRNNVRNFVERFGTYDGAQLFADNLANETDAERLQLLQTANKDIAELRESLQPYGNDDE